MSSRQLQRIDIRQIISAARELGPPPTTQEGDNE